MSLFNKLQKKSFYEVLPLSVYQESSETDKQSLKEHYIYQSNYIEGISYYPFGETVTSEDWERIQKEGVKPVPVWDDHANALEYVLKAFDKNPLNREETRKIHRLLMANLLFEKEVGHYRKEEDIIGKITEDFETGKRKIETVRRCPPPKSIPWLMKSYEASLQELATSTEISREKILENHAYFEWIHPFSDGNGRTGRLLLNWLSLKHLNEFLIVNSSKREEYYSFLRSLEGKFNSIHPRISKVKS
jgi:Fic family protein